MPLKVIWDYTFYWALLAPLYCAGLQCDLAVLGRVRDAFVRGSELNRAMQPLLRAWGARNRETGAAVDDGRLLDQARPAWFHALNAALLDTPDADGFVARTEANLRLMARLAVELRAQARIAHPELDTAALDALLAREAVDGEIEPLLPAIWYAQREAVPEPA